MTSDMNYIVTFGFKCPRKIHWNTQCPPLSSTINWFWSSNVQLFEVILDPLSPLKSNIIYGGSLGKDEIKVGDRVNVKDLVANDGTNKTRSCLGTVRFVGSVDFVKGDNK